MLLSTLSFRKILIALFGFVLIGIITGSYFLKVVPDKEKELNTRGFRILNRIEKNFFEKKSGYLNTIDEVISKNNTLHIIDGLMLKDPAPKAWAADMKNNRIKLEYDNSEDKWQMLFYSSYYKTTFEPPFIVKNVPIQSTILEKDSCLTYTYDFNQFIVPLIEYRNDFFEDYILFYNDSVIYQRSTLAFQNNTDADTVLQYQFIKSGKVFDVILAGKEYKAFYQPINKSANSNLIICGLISKENYNRTKFLLDNYEMTLVIGCFILLILIFPFMKMITITRYERMMKKDIRIMLICLLGISAISTVLLIPNSISSKNQLWDSENIHALNNRINNNLSNELNQQFNLLNTLEALIKQKDSANPFYHWYSENYFMPYSVNTHLPDFDSNHSFYQLFSNPARVKDSSYIEKVLFIDSAGIINAKWGATDDGMPEIDVSSRTYYKEIIHPYSTEWNNKNILSKDTGLNHSKYSFQPVYSYSSQENTVVLSKSPDTEMKETLLRSLLEDSKDNTVINKNILNVLAIETRLFSVMSPVLSNEYGFCIIDKKGQVLFHSDKSRNLRENFFEECVGNEMIRSAVYNHTCTDLTLNFYGKTYDAYISPLKNTSPLYVITFMDTTYKANFLADISNFVLIFLFLFIGMLVLIAVLSYLFIIRTKYLAKQNFDFKFLNFSIYNISIAKKLGVFIMLNTLIMIVPSLFLKGFDLIFFMAFMILNIPIIGSYITYHAIPFEKIIKWYPFRTHILKRYSVVVRITIMIGVFLLATFTLLNTKTIHEENTTVFMTTIFLVYYILAFYLTDNKTGFKKIGSTPLRFLWLLIDKVLLLFQNIGFKIRNKSSETSSPENNLIVRKQVTLYSFVLLLLLINICIVPGWLLFNHLTDMESVLTQNRRSIELSEHLNERKHYLSKIKQKSILLKDTSETSYKSILNKGIYSFVKNDTNIAACDSLFFKLYIAVIDIARSDYKDDEIKKIFSWHAPYNVTLPQDNPLISSKESTLKNRILHKGYIPAAIGVLYLLFILVRFLYKKITLIEYFFNSQNKFNDRFLLDHFESSNSNILVLTLPGSGIEEMYLNAEKLKAKNMVAYISQNTAELEGVFGKNNFALYSNQNKDACFTYLLLLRYVEFKTDKSEDLTDRILLWEDYFKSTEYKVIWLSYSDPSVQVEQLIKNSNAFYYKVSKDANYKDIEEYNRKTHDFDKMLKILDEFDKAYFSLTEYSGTGELNTLEQSVKDTYPYLYSVIDTELTYGLYLQKLRGLIFSQGTNSTDVAFTFFDCTTDQDTLFRNTPNLNEEIILKIQDIAYTYYLSIWNCLSTEEKFVLYDMAEDNLSNYHNLSTLLSLKEKGLLIYAEEFVIHSNNAYATKTLQIINKSFRNFILVRITPAEASLLEEELKGASTWQTLRIIVAVLIIIISVFIYMTQETLLQRFISLATGIAAFVPLIFKITSGFTDSSGPSEK